MNPDTDHTPTIKSCPFCGGTDIDAGFACNGAGEITAGCMTCGACGPSSNGSDPVASMRLWNARGIASPAETKAGAPLTLKELLRNYRHKVSEATEKHGAFAVMINAYGDPDWAEWEDVAAAQKIVDLMKSSDSVLVAIQGFQVFFFGGVWRCEYLQCDSLDEAIAAALAGNGGEAEKT